MVQLFKPFKFIHRKINSLQLTVVVKAGEGLNLVLLQIKLLKIDQGAKTIQILNEVGLTSYKGQLSQILKSIKTCQFVFGCVKLLQILKMRDIFYCPYLVIANIKDNQLVQAFQILNFSDSIG